jgi:hypothetical protein
MTLQEQVKEALKGIDEERTESPDGWWGTSEQAAFGAERLAKVLALIVNPPEQPDARPHHPPTP